MATTPLLAGKMNLIFVRPQKIVFIKKMNTVLIRSRNSLQKQYQGDAIEEIYDNVSSPGSRMVQGISVT